MTKEELLIRALMVLGNLTAEYGLRLEEEIHNLGTALDDAIDAKEGEDLYFGAASVLGAARIASASLHSLNCGVVSVLGDTAECTVLSRQVGKDGREEKKTDQAN